VSLEIGRSPADRDGQEGTETPGAGAAGAGSAGGASGPAGPGEPSGSRSGTQGKPGKPLRASVLAPFMAAGGFSYNSPSDEGPGPDETDEDATAGTPRDDATTGTPRDDATTGTPATAGTPENAAAGTPKDDEDDEDEENDATAVTPEAAVTTSALSGGTGMADSRGADTQKIGPDDTEEPDGGDATGEQGETEAPAEPGSGRASATADAVGAAAAVAGSVPSQRASARPGTGAGASGGASDGARGAASGAARGVAGGGDILDGPLLSDAGELRTNWLQVQARFVDDPPEAVSDAADLVEHAAQALVGALRLRQQQLREAWDSSRLREGGGRAGADGRAAASDADEPTEAAADSTEQLRLLMKRYRVLFNQICSP
jgi:hypothetical protein